MSTKVNEYIERRRKKKLKKKITIISIFVLAIFIFILLKAPAFNIKHIEVKNNNIVPSEQVLNLNSVLNTNIFLLNTNNVKEEVLLNPYIKGVKVQRKFPDKLEITVDERTVTFGLEDGEGAYVLNEELVIMEKRPSLNELNIPKVTGLNIENRFLGESITTDNRKLTFLKDIGAILNSEESMNINEIDITDINNIYLYSNGTKIIIGNDSDIDTKLTKAFNIIKSPELNFVNGYIDVSFSGNPVVHEGQEVPEEENSIEESVE